VTAVKIDWPANFSTKTIPKFETHRGRRGPKAKASTFVRSEWPFLQFRLRPSLGQTDGAVLNFNSGLCLLSENAMDGNSSGERPCPWRAVVLGSTRPFLAHRSRGTKKEGERRAGSRFHLNSGQLDANWANGHDALGWRHRFIHLDQIFWTACSIF
jgi:hypothetical protein